MIPPEIVVYGFAIIVIYKGYFVKQLETVLLVDYYFFIKTFTLSNLASTLSQFSKIPVDNLPNIQCRVKI